jgi:hypothetical protein
LQIGFRITKSTKAFTRNYTILRLTVKIYYSISIFLHLQDHSIALESLPLERQVSEISDVHVHAIGAGNGTNGNGNGHSAPRRSPARSRAELALESLPPAKSSRSVGGRKMKDMQLSSSNAGAVAKSSVLERAATGTGNGSGNGASPTSNVAVRQPDASSVASSMQQQFHLPPVNSNSSSPVTAKREPKSNSRTSM